jgi:hypothetical protein
MLFNYGIGYLKSNESTDDVVQESKVKYGQDKVKFEILDALIGFYEAERARINIVGQNKRTTTTTTENNLMSVEEIVFDYLSNVTSSTTTGLTLKEISEQLKQFSEMEIK